eukprot:gnl/TRDRNA2_/TRDRNA2_134556_c0_seq3.p1 gnl/TRDRNA2_/TRDRNA2_134556_c0~~gnl/TRDRNA2_/TRDRNA2_134556_c0_seq3.p1  ORF type:complete len:526 (-),score=70.33 gnl/TRDRNA2_/TRDRNA2_134556_c0_seq3:84-1661(-)
MQLPPSAVAGPPPRKGVPVSQRHATLLLWIGILAAGGSGCYAARLRTARTGRTSSSPQTTNLINNVQVPAKVKARDVDVSTRLTAVNNSGALGVNKSMLSKAHKSATKTPSFMLMLDNYKFVQYTAPFTLDGQELPVIYDTGSFEIIVLSDLCKDCDVTVPVYSSKKSDTFKPGSRDIKTHYFGSGAVTSKQGLETVHIGEESSPLSVVDMPFWQVLEHHVGNWGRQAQFSGIVGLGHTDRVPIHEDEDSNPDKVLLERAGVQEFAFCLERTRSIPHTEYYNAPGWLVFGPEVANMKNEPGFRTVPVVGEKHWGVKLSNFAPGVAKFDPCVPSCGAIVDSGTSLIAADEKVIRALEPLFEAVEEDCSNIDQLPDLVFDLDGKRFVLPPAAYVMEVEQLRTPTKLAVVNMLVNVRPSREKTCVPAFAQLDGTTPYGPLIILGMPFLRYYFTVFDRSHPPALHIAPSTTTCEPRYDAEYLFLNNASQNATSMHFGPHSPEDFLPTPADLDAVRIPHWARNMHGNVTI